MGLSGEASAPLGVRSAATALRSCLRQQQVGDRLPFSEDGGSPTSRAEETLAGADTGTVVTSVQVP